jgi:hypothetical protein
VLSTGPTNFRQRDLTSQMNSKPTLRDRLRQEALDGKRSMVASEELLSEGEFRALLGISAEQRPHSTLSTALNTIETAAPTPPALADNKQERRC